MPRAERTSAAAISRFIGREISDPTAFQVQQDGAHVKVTWDGTVPPRADVHLVRHERLWLLDEILMDVGLHYETEPACGRSGLWTALHVFRLSDSPEEGHADA